jgi:hypothetical protein
MYKSRMRLRAYARTWAGSCATLPNSRNPPKPRSPSDLLHRQTLPFVGAREGLMRKLTRITALSAVICVGRMALEATQT